MLTGDDFTGIKSQIVLLIGQLVILFFCIFYMGNYYNENIYPEKRAKEIFQQTNCFILSKKMSTISYHFTQHYRADFLISYNVGGTQYNRWVSGNGLDMEFGPNVANQERFLTQYAVGGTYPCWYDPDAPSTAVLNMRLNWLSTFPLIIPSVIGIIVLYYLLENIFDIAGAMIIRARERKERDEQSH